MIDPDVHICVWIIRCRCEYLHASMPLSIPIADGTCTQDWQDCFSVPMARTNCKSFIKDKDTKSSAITDMNPSVDHSSYTKAARTTKHRSNDLVSMVFSKYECGHIAMPRRNKSGRSVWRRRCFFAAAKTRTYQSQVAGAEEF